MILRYFFWAPQISVRNKKKILVKLRRCQKIFSGRYRSLPFFYITFLEIYLIIIKFGNRHWASKIIERNYERNFFVKTQYQKIFRFRT